MFKVLLKLLKMISNRLKITDWKLKKLWILFTWNPTSTGMKCQHCYFYYHLVTVTFEDTRIMLLRCLQPPSWCHYLCCCDVGGARFENCSGVEVEKNEGTGVQIILFSGLNYKYMFIFFKLVGPGLHQAYSTSFLSPLWKLMGCLIRHYLVLILDDDFRTENIR